ncbi:MAG: glycosyltransferase family 39 protein [Candidatus Omnitrophota bacterium]
MKKTEVIYTTIFFIILIYFLINTLLWLDKLGLNPDEAHYGQVILIYFTGLKKFLAAFGLQRSFYAGTIKSYLLFPFFAIFGPTVFVSRFTAVFFSLISLTCIYYVCSRWFNRLVGLCTAVLLGTNSTFIQVTRIGMERQEIIQIFLVWLGIALIQLYLDGKKKIYLYFSALVFGVALSAGIMFLAFFFGAIVAFTVLWDKSHRFLKKEIFKTSYDFVIFILMFIVGSSELLMFNIYKKGETIRVLWHSLWNIAYSGWNNLDFFNNLSTRYQQLNVLLANSSKINTGCPILVDTCNYFNSIFFYLSLTSIIFYLLLRNKNPLFSKQKILFLLMTYFVILILSCFTPTGNATVYQLIILFPAVQIICAIFLGLIFWLYKRKILQYSLLSLFMMPYMYGEFNIMRNYLTKVKNDTVDSPSYSTLIYKLAHYLEKNNITECLSVTFPVSYNIEFLTNQKVKVKYLGGGLCTEAFYESEIQKQRKIYIIAEKNDPVSIEFFAHLEKLIHKYKDKKNITFMKDFVDKDKAHFELYYIE